MPCLSARQLLDWQDYDAQFGLGIDRGDVYQAMMIACLYNAHRADTSPARSAEDFLVWNRPDRLEADISQADFVAQIRGMVPPLPAPKVGDK